MGWEAMRCNFLRIPLEIRLPPALFRDSSKVTCRLTCPSLPMLPGAQPHQGTCTLPLISGSVSKDLPSNKTHGSRQTSLSSRPTHLNLSSFFLNFSKAASRSTPKTELMVLPYPKDQMPLSGSHLTCLPPLSASQGRSLGISLDPPSLSTHHPLHHQTLT